MLGVASEQTTAHALLFERFVDHTDDARAVAFVDVELAAASGARVAVVDAELVVTAELRGLAKMTRRWFWGMGWLCTLAIAGVELLVVAAVLGCAGAAADDEEREGGGEGGGAGRRRGSPGAGEGGAPEAGAAEPTGRPGFVTSSSEAAGLASGGAGLRRRKA